MCLHHRRRTSERVGRIVPYDGLSGPRDVLNVSRTRVVRVFFFLFFINSFYKKEEE